MSFKSLVASLIVFTILPLFASEKKTNESVTTSMATALFVEEYRTFADLFLALKASQTMTDQDIDQITSFLMSKKIKTTDNIPLAKVTFEKISWGSTYFSYDKKEKVYRTSRGLALRPQKSESAADSFKRVYNEIDNSCKNCVSLIQFFIPPAYSGELANGTGNASTQVGKAAAALVQAIGWTWENGAAPALSCIMAFPTSVAGGSAIALKTVLHPLRSFLYDGSVSCKNGAYSVGHVDYKVLDLREVVKKELDSDDKSIQFWASNNPVNKICSGLIINGLGNSFNLFAPKVTECPHSLSNNCDSYVEEAPLEVAFNVKNSNEIPTCTTTNAKKVEESLKKQASEQENRIYKIMAENAQKSSGADKTPEGINPSASVE